LIALACGAWPGGDCTAQVTAVRKPRQTPPSLLLTPLDKAYLLGAARAHIYGEAARREVAEIPAGCKSGKGVPVFITLFRSGSAPLTVMATAGSLAESVKAASVTARIAPEFVSRRLDASRQVRIKVDVLLSKKLIFPHPSMGGVLPMVPGLEGIYLRRQGREGYLLPSDIIAHELGGRTHLLEAACFKAGLTPEAWKSLNTEVYRIDTSSFIEDAPGGKMVELYRAVPLVRRLSRGLLMERASAAGRWLVSNQQKDGRFLHAFSPITGKVLPLPYNIVRHAGVTLSLLELYEATQEREFMESAERAVRFLADQIEVADKPEGTAFVYFNETAKLGASALAVTALVRFQQASHDKRYQGLLSKLGNFLLFMQKKDGSVYTTYSFQQRERKDDAVSCYYSSQAVLAFAELYEVTREDKWLKAALLTADYIMNRREAEMKRAEPPQDHWAMIALAELYELLEDNEHAEYCMRVAETMLQHQLTTVNTAFLDYVGASDTGVAQGSPPTAVSTACKCEGLVAAWRVAGKMKLERGRYAEAVRSALKFILQNQYTAVNSYYLREPSRAVGAFRTHFLDDGIYMDHVQHCISAILGGRDVVGNR